MTMKTRQCFLIDSLLEKKSQEGDQEEPVDLMKRSPSTSSQPEETEEDEEAEEEEEDDDEEAEQEDGGPSRLTQLLTEMMDNEKKKETPPPVAQRPLFPMGNPMEYLSKLQMMHAFNLSALALRQPFPPPLLPLLRKDCIFPRPPLIRPPRAACDVSRNGNVKKYRCDVCDKTFSRSNTLITHKRIHTGEKPFKCEHCGRAFRQPGNLTRHRLTHTTVKPYVCAHCDKAFNRASNLHTHMRTHTGK